MHLAVSDVLDFHKKMNQAIGDPRKPDLTTSTELRWNLIKEEFEELTLALQGKDKHGNDITGEEQVIAVADALADLAYVTVGAGVTWGIDLGAVWDAVHASNMTKSADQKRADGKVCKGPNYREPDIKGALAQVVRDVEIDGFGDEVHQAWPVPTVESGLPLPKPETEIRSEINTSFSPYNGVFLARGAFVFDCPCSRMHEISLLNGTRGGRATQGSCDCICGRHFDFTFGIERDHDIVKESKVTCLNM